MGAFSRYLGFYGGTWLNVQYRIPARQNARFPVLDDFDRMPGSPRFGSARLIQVSVPVPVVLVLRPGGLVPSPSVLNPEKQFKSSPPVQPGWEKQALDTDRKFGG